MKRYTVYDVNGSLVELRSFEHLRDAAGFAIDVDGKPSIWDHIQSRWLSGFEILFAYVGYGKAKKPRVDWLRTGF